MNLRLLFLLLTFVSATFAGEPPPLRRPDAKRILELMEWREVNIITIQQGINAKGNVAPIFATVVAIGTRDNRHQPINQTLSYDEEYGWFFYELVDKGARMWTKDGYKEIKLWGTW